MRIHIKENSLIARIAAWKMKSSRMAIVVGRTIHLYNVSGKEFIKNKPWLNHEMEHVRQYRKHGLIPFIVKYLIETSKKGYYNNKFEVSARAAENDD